MKDFEEKACLCALAKIFGFEPKTALALIAHCGCAGSIFSLDEKDIDGLLGPYSRYRTQIRRSAVYEAAESLERLGRDGIRFVGWGEEGYPELLAECPDAPIGLYVRSCTPPSELWNRSKNIAIVGTRDISPYGREWCCRMVEGMAGCTEKPLIVSGLALGTDICAHKSAVEQGLPTVAVMPTGPDSIYPFRHIEFAERICSTPGCALVTDYPPGTPPLAIHFLRRNRIIAGLSHSTILTESKIKGGGMMTARLAFSYDRDVYALPGRVDDIRSQGCNLLVKSKIAEPIVSVEDLIRSLGMKGSSKERASDRYRRMQDTYAGRLDTATIGKMEEILRLISTQRGITVEDIAASSGMDYSQAATFTSMLEMDGFIQTDLLQRCFIIIGKNR